MEKDIYKNFENGSLTQVDLIKLILHNAQHMATREDVKNDISKSDDKLDKVEQNLKDDIAQLDKKIDKVELNLTQKIDKVELNLTQKIDKVELNLTQKIDKLEVNLKEDIAQLHKKTDKLELKIDKIDSKFDRVQWLIVSTILAVFLKDYIIELFSKLSA